MNNLAGYGMRPRFSRTDWIIAASLGAAVFLLMTALPYPDFHPSILKVWNEAAGLRPPESALPGLWRTIVSCFAGVFGPRAVILAAPLVGRLLGGAVAGLLYLTFRRALELGCRMPLSERFWHRFMAPFLSALAAFFGALSEPMWRAMQAFSPEGLDCAIAVSIPVLLLSHFANGRLLPLYASFALMGALFADTPFGIAFPVVAMVALVFGWRLRASAAAIGDASAERDPADNVAIRLVEPGSFPRFHLTLCWTLGFAAAIAVSTIGFIRSGGPEAAGGELFELVHDAIVDWILSAAGGSGPGTVSFSIAVVTVVFAFGMHLLPGGTDGERRIGFFEPVFGALSCIGLLAWLCGPEQCRLGAWISGFEPYGAGPALAALFSAASLLFVGSALSVWIFFRWERREEAISPDVVRERTVRCAADDFCSRLVFFAVPVALAVASSVLARRETTMRAVMEAVSGFCAETVRECDSARFLFSDGAFDEAIELKAAAMGTRVTALSMLAGGSEHERAVRRRDLADEADLEAASRGAPVLLRSWADTGSRKLDECAFQLGFEYWRRNSLPPPRAAGTVARMSAVMSAGEAKRGAAAARALAARLKELSADFKRVPDRAVRDAAWRAMWRLSRIARQRADAADAAGSTEEGGEERAFADELDEANVPFVKLRSAMERTATFAMMTSREQLKLALGRADFNAARGHALAVLRTDPDDAAANFALGMAKLLDGEHAAAVEHLAKCHEARPDDAAVLNNLAIAEMKLGRLDDAARDIASALVKKPDDAEIRRTARTIDEARAKAAAAKDAKRE